MHFHSIVKGFTPNPRLQHILLGKKYVISLFYYYDFFSWAEWSREVHVVDLILWDKALLLLLFFVTIMKYFIYRIVFTVISKIMEI